MAENSASEPVVTCDGAARSGLTGAERQARYRARLRRLGAVAVTIMVPVDAAPDFHLAAEALRTASHLRLGPLRDPLNGKMVSAKRVLAGATGRKNGAVDGIIRAD